MKKWWPEITILILLGLWASGETWLEISHLITGLPHAKRYILDMFPPDWSILPDLRGPLIETIRMGMVATAISSIMAIPLSILASKYTSPNIVLYVIARGIINICRSTPTMVWALLMVSMVGLGPLAGIIALTLHSTGSLSKVFSEALESVGPTVADIMEAMKLDGATNLQAFYYGLFRQVVSLFIGFVLYYFEWSLRVGTTLGLVGAGGLGLQLIMTIRMFRRQQTLTILLVILGMVGIVDFTSYLIRRRLV